MPFIHNDKIPLIFRKVLSIAYDHFIGGDHNDIIGVYIGFFFLVIGVVNVIVAFRIVSSLFFNFAAAPGPSHRFGRLPGCLAALRELFLLL